MNHDVFISYSSKEKNVADGVCHYLEGNGIKCWMAPRDIPAGADYGDLIDEAIKTCRVTVLVYSKNSFVSKWVKGEINVAFDENKPIAPFRIDETEIQKAFRVMLNQMHWIDAYPNYADRLPDLLQSVCGLLGRPIPNTKQSQKLSAYETKASPEPAEMELHIEVDTDCRVYHFHTEILVAKKGEDNSLMLKRGRHRLRFVAVANPKVTDERVIEVSGNTFSDFINITLEQKLMAIHKAKVEADKKAAEETTARKNEAEKRAKKEAEQKAMDEAKRKAKEEDWEYKKSPAYMKKVEDEYVAKGYTLIGAGKTALTWHDVSKSLKKVIIAHSVTSIEEYALRDCETLSSVIIPNSVTSIKKGAFKSCKALSSITIPNSVISIGEDAFCLCSALSSVIIPDSNISIGENAFDYCLSLSYVTIPNSVQKIGLNAFRHVKNITYYGTVPEYMLGAITVNGYVEDDLVFRDPSKKELTAYIGRKSTVEIPNTVIHIGHHAFYYCTWLTNIKIPNSVKKIDDSAFRNSGLTSIVIPNSVTIISDHTFSECRNLSFVIIPNSVTHIGFQAFSLCKGLTSIIIPGSVTSIGDWAFFGCNLTSITIPASVKSIGEGAFNSCNRLRSVKLLSRKTRYKKLGNLNLRTFQKGAKITKPSIFG